MKEQLRHQKPIDLLVPYHQKTGYSCGPASLAMMLRCYGVKVTEREIVDEIRIDKEGADWSDIRDYLNDTDISYTFNANSTYTKMMQDFQRLHLPILVMWTTNRPDNDPDNAHFSVVKDIKPGSITLADPAYGDFYTLSEQEFDRLWYGGSVKRGYLILSSIF